MNISDIKYKANEVLNANKIYMNVFIAVALFSYAIEYIFSLLGVFIPFLGFVGTIVLLPFSHGNVVTALKATNEDSDISVEIEGLTGIRRFKELFSTYFIHNLFIVVIVVLVVLLFLIALMISSSGALNELGTVVEEVAKTGYTSVPYSEYSSLFISGGIVLTVGTIVVIVIGMYLSISLVLTPYVLEKYKIKNIAAIKESYRLMKGRKWTFFLLQLSYFGWLVLAVAISILVGIILPIPVIANVITSLVSVYLFTAKVNTAIAVFYQEIDLEDKQIINNTGEVNE